MSDLSHREIQRIVKEKLQEVFGPINPVGKVLKEKYPTTIGFMRRLFEHIEKLEHRIEALEGQDKEK